MTTNDPSSAETDIVSIPCRRCRRDFLDNSSDPKQPGPFCSDECADAALSPHTTGPWITGLSENKDVYNSEEHFCVLSNPETGTGQIIADIEGSTTPEAEANARLISAAPELLKACKAAEHILGQILADLEGDQGEGACFTDLRDAIAKAGARR